ncbi:MAG: protease complex subunit PrcB family protein, partial [Bacillota bacterium]
QWYEKNYKVVGLHAFSLGTERYLLLSVGEKPTGGYYIENVTLLGKEKEIEVKAKLHSPQPGQNVTEALTYPHILIGIKEDGRQLVFGGVTGNNPTPVPRKDTGKYVGQIDNNSIEIRVSGVPEKISARAFKLGDSVRDKFSALQLKTGEEIGFTYVEKPNQQPVILEIYRLKNTK